MIFKAKFAPGVIKSLQFLEQHIVYTIKVAKNCQQFCNYKMINFCRMLFYLNQYEGHARIIEHAVMIVIIPSVIKYSIQCIMNPAISITCLGHC